MLLFICGIRCQVVQIKGCYCYYLSELVEIMGGSEALSPLCASAYFCSWKYTWYKLKILRNMKNGWQGDYGLLLIGLQFKSVFLPSLELGPVLCISHENSESALTGINRINFVFKRALISNLFPLILCFLHNCLVQVGKKEGSKASKQAGWC